MKQNSTRFLCMMLCSLLIAASALGLVSCTEEKTPDLSKTFTLQVVDANGQESTHTITSDKKTVGEALLDEKLIEGEEGAYGLYVKKVCGISADYETDGTYWAFYVGDAYATHGVDQTEITDGATYAFKVEKG